MEKANHESKNMVTIRYTNYRGETADRKIIPIRIRFGSSERPTIINTFDESEKFKPADQLLEEIRRA